MYDMILWWGIFHLTCLEVMIECVGRAREYDEQGRPVDECKPKPHEPVDMLHYRRTRQVRRLSACER